MLEEELRQEAARLLEAGEVEVFIGYVPGTLPARSTIAFLRSSEDAGQLIFDPTCNVNLAAYLPRWKKRRVGVVLKACDARALVELVRERQVDPANVVVIGVECPGVIDRAKLADGAYSPDDWRPARADACSDCRLPDADIFHLWLGERRAAESPPQDTGIREADADQRYAWFSAEMEKCIRCYACRQACPACYCPECFTDRGGVEWVSPVHQVPEAMLFHLVRTLHLAGRCVDCGACVRACPQGIDLLALHRRMEEEVTRRFGYVPGQDPEAASFMGSFSKDDPDDFIK